MWGQDFVQQNYEEWGWVQVQDAKYNQWALSR